MATALHLRRGLPSLLPRLARKLPPPKLGLCDGDEEYETYEALARTPLVPPWARSEGESDAEAFNKV